MFYEINIKIVNGVGYPEGDARAEYSNILEIFGIFAALFLNNEYSLRKKVPLPEMHKQ